MPDLITAKHRTLRIYSCGGTAINLLRAYRDNLPPAKFLLSDERYSYIDTSVANLNNASMAEVFLLEGVDGSGSNRPKNAAAIKAALPKILLEHSPEDFNVVMFSAAGGTGSVAGPMLLEELLKTDKKAVAIVIGSHESLKRTTNTIGTLQGLQIAVKRVGRPIVMHYRENDLTKSVSDNNLQPLFVLNALSIFTSGRNGHLDSSDVGNLFDFHTVTHHQPVLAMFDVYADNVPSDLKNPIGLAALLNGIDKIVPQLDPDYDTVGYLPEDVKVEKPHSFFYVVTTQGLSTVFNELNAKRDKASQQQQVKQSTTSLINDKTQTDDETGLVF